MYGKQSSYLYRSMFRYGLYSLIWGLIGAILLLIFALLFRNLFTFGGIFVLLIFGAPLAWWIKMKYKRHDTTSENFYRGKEGECIIGDELNKLPNDFLVFQDIKMEKGGNIDFVVLGLTGLFTIEVKSHHGQIGFNGQELTLNSQPFPEKDVLKQAMREAFDLHNYIKIKLHKDIFVHPVLVFSNYVKINFGQKPVNKVYVVQKSYLLDLIKNRPHELSSQVISEIDSVLKKLVS